MELFLLMSITGLVGLAASVGMLYMAHHPRPDSSGGFDQFDRQGRDDFFRRIKFNAGRLK